MLLSVDKSISQNLIKLNKIYSKAKSFDDINTNEFKSILRQTITLALLSKEKVSQSNILTSQIISSSKLQDFLYLKNIKEIQNFLKDF